jgi:hypothetical protein
MELSDTELAEVFGGQEEAAALCASSVEAATMM